MTTYQVVLKTLSPVHIGDGEELRQGFDFSVHTNRTYRLNEDEILLRKEKLLKPDSSGRYPLPGNLLDDRDFDDPALFHYVLRGIPRSNMVDARVRSCIKDVFFAPYIPGSSIKGAMRTALAWNGWQEVGVRFDRSAVGRSKYWAAQPLERRIFGPDPNHDILRALQVSDFLGPKAAGEKLLLVNAQVMNRQSNSSPVELEAISGDTAFTGSIHIDTNLFSAISENELHFKSRQHWLDELLPRIQRHSLARIVKLAGWFEGAEGGERIASFYRQLEQAQVGAHQALLQVGWGSGWDGKTFWTHLQSDPQLFEQLISDFRMTLGGRAAPRSPGDAFPRSRRVAMVIKDGVARPVAPFGWILLEMTGK